MGAPVSPLDIVPCEPLHARMTASSCVGRHVAAQTPAGWRTGLCLRSCVTCPVGAARAELLGVTVPAQVDRHAHVYGLTTETAPCARCHVTYRTDRVKGIDTPLRAYCPSCRATSRRQRGEDVAARVDWLTTAPRVILGTPSGRSRIASLPPVPGR